jgi:hypothetical protein
VYILDCIACALYFTWWPSCSLLHKDKGFEWRLAAWVVHSSNSMLVACPPCFPDCSGLTYDSIPVCTDATFIGHWSVWEASCPFLKFHQPPIGFLPRTKSHLLAMETLRDLQAWQHCKLMSLFFFVWWVILPVGRDLNMNSITLVESGSFSGLVNLLRMYVCWQSVACCVPSMSHLGIWAQTKLLRSWMAPSLISAAWQRC